MLYCQDAGYGSVGKLAKHTNSRPTVGALARILPGGKNQLGNSLSRFLDDLRDTRPILGERLIGIRLSDGIIEPFIDRRDFLPERWV